MLYVNKWLDREPNLEPLGLEKLDYFPDRDDSIGVSTIENEMSEIDDPIELLLLILEVRHRWLVDSFQLLSKRKKRWPKSLRENKLIFKPQNTYLQLKIIMR